MNQKMKLLILSMSMSALLITACNDTGKGTTQTDADDDGTGAVTIHTVTSEYSSAKYPKGDDITNNVWTRRYKEKDRKSVV